MTNAPPPLPVIVIGAVYLDCATPLICDAALPTANQVRLRTIDKPYLGKWVRPDQLTGPVSMPCPVCGQMQPVRPENGHEGLGRHLVRCGAE